MKKSRFLAEARKLQYVLERRPDHLWQINLGGTVFDVKDHRLVEAMKLLLDSKKLDDLDLLMLADLFEECDQDEPAAVARFHVSIAGNDEIAHKLFLKTLAVESGLDQ